MKEFITSFTFLFYIKKGKTNTEGEAPIYLRITVNGERAELSIKRNVAPDKWNSSACKVKGIGERAQSINKYIDGIKTNIYVQHEKLTSQGKTITAEILRNKLTGGNQEKNKSLVELFKYHNQQVKELAGKEMAIATYTRYETTLRHVIQFLQWKYKKDDVSLDEVTHNFISELDFFLRSVRNNSNNTCVKYIKNFKKIIRIALSNNWIEHDPFINYKGRVKVIEKHYLTELELNAISIKELHTIRLDQVRDIFVFCCYTGLAYADVKKLSYEHVVIGIDGEQWIKTNRTKTDVKSSIPLLPPALKILDKYKEQMAGNKLNRLLPVLSGQKMNAYLKEIADICCISKNMSMHLGRHSFATLMLTNGVSIESVSKMLGHTNIRTTQHYAKILDQKISEDIKYLKERFK